MTKPLGRNKLWLDLSDRFDVQVLFPATGWDVRNQVGAWVRAPVRNAVGAPIWELLLNQRYTLTDPGPPLPLYRRGIIGRKP